MPRYLLYATTDGCYCFSEDSPHVGRLPPEMQPAGEFEAADDAAAVEEARRRVAELQARMEAK